MTRRRWLAFAAVCAVTAVAYTPSLSVPFQFDDYARIGENQAMLDGDYLQALQWLGNSRLIPSLTVIGNYAVGGFEPIGYHVVNLSIHLLATLGVFQLALVLCRTPRLRGTAPAAQAERVAFVAALLFACHPLQTQAVTYIIQRYASMAAMFYIWSVVCYVRGRNRRVGAEPGRAGPWYAATAVLALCAVLSKENAASLPLAILLTEWVFFGLAWSRRTWVQAALVVGLMLALPLAWKVMTFRALVPREGGYAWWEILLAVLRLESAPVPLTVTPLGYLLTQCTVIPRYLALLVLPWGLNVDHDAPPVEGLTGPVVAGMALLVGLLGLGFYAARRWPLVGYGILWLFVALSIESSLLPITDAMMEHRMYLAMPGVALAAASLFAIAASRVPRLARPVGAVLATALVALTFARNVVWQSPLTLWQDAVEKSPNKARVHVNVGVAHHGLNHLDVAIAQYCEALRLDPEVAMARENLEIALEQWGLYDAVMAKVIGEQQAKGGDPEGLILELDIADSYCNE